ncbi:hypothetical protein Golax_022880, partial [Gossypium laxum]|nr:hypothetical protein [Gossypium laxum]
MAKLQNIFAAALLAIVQQVRCHVSSRLARYESYFSSGPTSSFHCCCCLELGMTTPEWLKCNIDASIYQGLNTTSFVIVIHNAKGEFVKAFLGHVSTTYDQCLVEIFSILEALLWLKAQQFDRIIIESDCLDVVNVLISSSVNNSEF